MRLSVLTSWYLRNERWISTLSLFGGFVFDSLTLKRVDLLWENLWVIGLLVIAALGIILINLNENQKNRFSAKVYRIIHFWLIIVIQFAFGGLLSSFLVFYFRSSTLSVSWPFLLVLATIFVLNEFLKHHYTRLVFQISVLFFSIYSFAIFIVPVILHRLGYVTFILSGLLSVVVLVVFVFCLRYIARERFRESKNWLFLSIIGITVLINTLYFTNLIPPIPLSLKSAGVYHSIVRNADGNYTAMAERKWFLDFFKTYETFNNTGSLPIYVFSSIFSPTNLNVQVLHEWQHYDETAGEWITTNQTSLSIVGGRDGGFRTYSIKATNVSGLWRVNVKTLRGQLIGRIKFKVKNVDATPDLVPSSL